MFHLAIKPLGGTLAVKQVIMSDVSNTEVPDEQHVRVVARHPDTGYDVELDLSKAEADLLADTTLRLVKFTVYEPNVPPREVAVETKQLDRLFKGVDFDAVLTNARRAPVASVRPAGGRPARGNVSKAASGEKKDYASSQWAGVEHRGRVTEAEATWVRENLDAANANRAREGQDPIDPKVEKFAKRYGF